MSSVVVTSVFDEIPVIDVDCVDKETILIVERDAGEVMVPVAEVPVIEMLAEIILAVGVLVKELPIVVPIGSVLAPVRELPMIRVPLIEALELGGLMTEDPLPEKPVVEMPVVTELLTNEVVVLKGVLVELLVAGPVAVAILLDTSVDGTADEEPMKEETLVAIGEGERSVKELEMKMPLA